MPLMQMAGDKSHKKKKKKTTKKTEKKRKVAKERLAGKDDTGKSEAQCQEDARQRNPKAFVFSSRGKAKVQKARSAEKEQRRMHGQSLFNEAISSKLIVSLAARTL